jgi:hypothetical protein
MPEPIELMVSFQYTFDESSAIAVGSFATARFVTDPPTIVTVINKFTSPSPRPLPQGERGLFVSPPLMGGD